MGRRLLAVAAVTALAVTGCTADADRPRPPRPNTAPSSPAAVPAAFPLGVQWHLVEYQLPGEPRVLVQNGSFLILRPGDRYYVQACNGYDGEAAVVGDRIDFGGGGASQMQCHGAERALEDAVYRVLRDARWEIEGTRLTLRTDDGGTFRYESGDALAPGTGHTVVEGARRGRPYRVWTVGSGDEVVLWAGSLDLAGRGRGTEVLANPRADEHARTASVGSGPAEVLVVGFAPAGTVRMTYRKPKRGPETGLPLYEVPGVRWKVFAGFAERSMDAWLLTAYDARGRRLAPFTGERPAT